MHKILWAKGLAKFFLILPVSILIGLSACNKSSIVGLEIQPENDLINAEFLDSLTLLTQTFKEDTLRTDVNIGYSGIGLIGKYIDPIFGEATSSLYTQLRMYSSAPVFGSNPLCDSVKLTLYYIDAYGELTKHQQTINVYHLIGDIDINANYFSNQTIAASSIDLANGYVFTPQPSDSIEIKGVKQAPQLRVPLEKSFGQDILNQQYTTNLANNTEFVKYIKGLYITTEKTQGLMSGQGSILRFNLNYSSVDIYYKYRPLNAVKDSATQYSIRLGSVASLSNFSHNYLSALPDLKNQIAAGITPAQNENIYVQSMAGLKAKITYLNGQKRILLLYIKQK